MADDEQLAPIEVGDYLVPTDPADLTICESCQ